MVALAPRLALSIEAKRAGGVREVLCVTWSPVASRVIMTSCDRDLCARVVGVAELSWWALVCRVTA